mmetsp:Transcript_18635/g.56285  ORF Transcript_18635/g.56285 Transcript_18635/m.56285 type:complete len:514 (+) Transcript_18635:178-1719(+)
MLGLAGGPARLFPDCHQCSRGSRNTSARVKVAALDRRQVLGIMSHSALASGLHGNSSNGATATSDRSGDSQEYPTIEAEVGNTPLVRLQRLPGRTSNVILAKLEGDNPAGSVKDRPAISMISEAEKDGSLKPGDTLIEATSGNTGIALAMAAAIKGYSLKLIMPSNMSEERRAAMAAYGAELISVPAGKMEMARDLAREMESRGEGVVLDQFGNSSNPLAHYRGTGPEIWQQTGGRVTHFVSSMGTTGTIMGTSRFLKEKNADVQIVGLQPADGASIAGIRKWPKEYLPSIFDKRRVDRVMEISQREAEETMRSLARVEGIFAGVSSGGAISAALRLSDEVENATIVAIVCDRGDRYLSTGVFSEAAAAKDPQPCTVEEFPSAKRRLPFFPAPHLVLFRASDDPATGESWCPDVRRTLPAVEAAVAEAGGTLLQVLVGDRPTWKSPDHPFRTDMRLHIGGVPTLLHWTSDGAGARLGSELERAPTTEAAKQLVSGFIRSLPMPQSRLAAANAR